MHIDPRWMPDAKMSRIIVHWTAGTNKANGLDRKHYHILIEGDGTLVRGIPPISGNSEVNPSGPRASHTLNCNTGSIGVSLCGMAGAVQSPFKPGPTPITAMQWNVLPGVLADLCRRYDIPVTPRTVLSHAEVQGTLGIRQRQKWDIAILPFAPDLNTPTLVGDRFRRWAAQLL